jgi:hypothetical protein
VALLFSREGVPAPGAGWAAPRKRRAETPPVCYSSNSAVFTRGER